MALGEGKRLLSLAQPSAKPDIGIPQLRPPRCDTRLTPEEKRRFLARRAQETKQRRALFNADTDAETTSVRFQNYFMNNFHFRGGWKYCASCPLHTILFAILTCAQRTRVHFCPSFGFILVRVRYSSTSITLSEHGRACHFGPLKSLLWPLEHLCLVALTSILKNLYA